VNERDIFQAAVEFTDAAERSAYLEQACAGNPSLRQHVERLLQVYPQLGTFLESPAVAWADAANPPSSAGRFQLGPELARGGMGVVYGARDESLGRDVAIKVLHERYPVDSLVGQRFLDEARITAQLQHPGIPPVFEVGRLGDGRPYLAMKLIKGRTMEDLLKERPEPASDRGRFLAMFAQICQAVGYAHSKHVLHRDLKPANVMVGAFGEVQVMDWGLAKLLAPTSAAAHEPAATETAAGTVILTTREPESATLVGSMLGTPAFMAPEQAGGELDRIDERADVFGLGAILCAILTGEPPYTGKSGEDVRLMAIRGTLADAHVRLDQCGADEKLVELCRACLSTERDARPRDAGAVAATIAGYLTSVEERARQAEREWAAAEARAAEQRKRRRVQLALCAAVGVLLAGGGAFAWWSGAQVQAARARQGRNAEAVAGLLDQCEEALGRGDTARAVLTLEAARKRAAEGGADEWAARLKVLEADVALSGKFDEIDQFRWTPVESQYPYATTVAARYREVLAGSGAAPDAGSPEAVVARALSSAVRDRITAAWDRLLPGEKTASVRTALQAVDADPYRDAIRDAVRADDREKIAAWAARPEALKQPAEFTAFLGESGAIGVRRRRQLLEAALWRRPGDPGLLITMGDTYPWNQAEGSDERLRWYQAAVAAAPTNPAAHYVLGAVLRERKELAGAEAAYRAALRLDPKFAPAQAGLGNVLYDRKDLAGTEAAYRAALRLDPKYAPAHSYLGNVLYDRKDLAGAEAAYRAALRLDSKLSMAHHGLGLVLRSRKDSVGAEAAFRAALRLNPKDAWAHNNLGDVLYGKDLAGAEAAYRAALRVDPKLSMAHHGLGLVLRNRQDLAGAEAAYRAALRLDPNFAMAYNSLGAVLWARHDLSGAEAAYRAALRLDPKLSMAHHGLGLVLRDRQDLSGAEAAHREAIRLDPNFAMARISLGAVLSDRHDLSGAEAAFREALRLVPNFAMAHNNLGNMLWAKTDLAGAEAAFREAIRLDPKFAWAHSNLGNVLFDRQDLAGAEAALREALRLDPKLAIAHYGLGRALQNRHNLAGAEAAFREALRLNPKFAPAHNKLAVALHEKGDLDGAVAELQEALRLDPKNSNTRANLLRAERMRALLRRLPEVVAGKAKPKSSDEACAFARLCAEPFQKRYAAAARLFEWAFTADPKLAANLKASHRYDASCYAVLAASGKGIDPPADTTARAALRQMALGWLRADLALHRQQAAAAGAAERGMAAARMAWWLKDSDLATVRDPEPLAKLPAAERPEWEKLWAEVRALRDQTAPQSARAPRQPGASAP
jgi:tetratricopeptide (TPR) repeat protein/serine/threonine protein kinase